VERADVASAFRRTAARSGASAAFALAVTLAGVHPAAAQSAPDLVALERAVAADPENLETAAQYRQLTIARRDVDRAIDVFEKLAKAKGSGANVYISLALAYIDKVPTSGDIRRLYLGRDAMSALTRSIERRPTAFAYYTRGLINLFYNRFIFKRTDKGVADLNTALSMVNEATPSLLVKRIYTALGDGYFRLGDLTKARAIWSAGVRKFPADEGFASRLGKQGEPLADVVTTALTASTRVDTSLNGMLPVR
jgi:tetratricopeptide (TPR) repeat protein